MLKRLEMTDPTSCLSKAGDDELIFVLLARDPAAGVAVQAWIDERISQGKNASGDDKITSARQWLVEYAQRGGNWQAAANHHDLRRQRDELADACREAQVVIERLRRGQPGAIDVEHFAAHVAAALKRCQ